MTAPTASRSRIVARAAMTGVVVCLDAFIAILTLSWQSQHGDSMTWTERAAYILVGAGAAAGVLIGLLALAATVAALHGGGRGTSSTALALAWIRVLAVVAAAIGLGVIASDDFYLAVLAILDGLVTLVVAVTARRLTDRPR